MKIVKYVALLMLVLIMPGCAGLAVGTYDRHETLNSSPSLSKGKGQRGLQSHAGAYSEAEIVQLWGKPDEVKESGSCRLLVYNDGLAWSGVFAFVGVVPVPVAVPVGHYKNTFYLQEGKCVGLVSQYGEVGSAFGWMMSDEKAGFVSGDVHNGVRKVATDFCR